MKKSYFILLWNLILVCSFFNVKAQSESETVVVVEEKSTAILPEIEIKETLADRIFDADLNTEQTKVTVQLKQIMSSFEVKIYNADKKQFLSISQYGQNSIEIPVANLPSGVYTIEIKTSNNSFVKKISKK